MRSLHCLSFIWKNSSQFQSLKWKLCWRSLYIPTCTELSLNVLSRKKCPYEPVLSFGQIALILSLFCFFNQSRKCSPADSELRSTLLLAPVHAQASWSLGKRLTSGDFCLFVSLCSSKLFEIFRLFTEIWESSFSLLVTV